MNSFQDRNGGATTYAFSFPSIAVTDIKVTVDDVEQTYLTHYQVDSYSTTSGGTVNFSVGGAAATYKNTAGATVTGTPPATQALNVRVYRQTKLINTSTGLAAPEADFTPGSSIRASDLDNNQSQIIYATQEERDQTITEPDLKDGIITNAKIAALAEIEVSKLKDGDARQLLQTNTESTGVEWASNIDVPGTLDVTGAVTFDSNLSVDGTLDVNGTLKVNTTKFTVQASNGNTTIDGSLTVGDNVTVTGSTTVNNILDVNGSATVDNVRIDANEIDTTEGNLTIDSAGGTVTVDDNLNVDGTVDCDNITGNAVVTSGTSTSDTKVYSAKRCDELYYNLASAEEIQSGETWVAADNKVATTAAIDARIVDLVDDVGGFVPIANETSFPNANPDVNNGAGTLVSVPLANSLTSNAGGYIYISNGTVGNSTVTIVGAGESKTYASGFGIIVETTTTLNEYVFHRYVPKATEVTTVATNISSINSVAGNATNINQCATNNNINIVGDNIINVNKVGAIDSDVTAVAGDAADIGACSTNIGSIAAIGSDLANNFENITDYGSITGAVTSTSGTSDITTVANSIANVNAVGPIAANVTTVAGISTEVTTVAGINANVTTVANAATNIGTCASNISAITDAPTQATNAANSATAAASSASTATTQATNANTHQLTAKQYRDDASGIKTQSESIVYNLSDSVSSHSAWGDVTDVGPTYFASESGNVLLTMSKGSSTYNYGSIT